MPVHNAASERYAYFEHAADLEYVEGHGCMRGAQPVNVSGLAKKRQRGEMGTLGSGNHYLEVQVVETIYDARAPGRVSAAQGMRERVTPRSSIFDFKH